MGLPAFADQRSARRRPASPPRPRHRRVCAPPRAARDRWRRIASGGADSGPGPQRARAPRTAANNLRGRSMRQVCRARVRNSCAGVFEAMKSPVRARGCAGFAPECPRRRRRLVRRAAPRRWRRRWRRGRCAPAPAPWRRRRSATSSSITGTFLCSGPSADHHARIDEHAFTDDGARVDHGSEPGIFEDHASAYLRRARAAATANNTRLIPHRSAGSSGTCRFHNQCASA